MIFDHAPAVRAETGPESGLVVGHGGAGARGKLLALVPGHDRARAGEGVRIVRRGTVQKHGIHNTRLLIRSPESPARTGNGCKNTATTVANQQMTRLTIKKLRGFSAVRQGFGGFVSDFWHVGAAEFFGTHA